MIKTGDTVIFLTLSGYSTKGIFDEYQSCYRFRIIHNKKNKFLTLLAKERNRGGNKLLRTRLVLIEKTIF